MPSESAVPSSVPSCHLYKLAPSQRIRKELIERGIDIDKHSDTTIDVHTLNEIDGMRYEASHGTDIFKRHLDSQFGKDSSISVLDIGSGFGGPARLLALTRPNTRLVALELVPEISEIAQTLSERTQVSDSVTHVTGDICGCSSLLPLQQFHALQAALSLLHVPDIQSALTSACQKLEPNGVMYIEDFCIQESDVAISEKSLNALKHVVGCPRGSPMTRDEWVTCLKDAGFQGDIDFQDVTDTWQPWVHERRLVYEKDMDRHVRVHGQEAANLMLEFYETMDSLFSTELRGCRILAKKK
jgi:2-polyprenyl-3-methyl-5-hydroxy-6-metoxy-1,4-benzoquinol methylase